MNTDFPPIDYNKIFPQELNKEGDVELLNDEHDSDHLYDCLSWRLKNFDFFHLIKILPNDSSFIIKLPGDTIEEKQKLFKQIREYFIKRKTRSFKDYTVLPYEPDIINNKLTFSVGNQTLRNFVLSLANIIKRTPSLQGKITASQSKKLVVLTFLETQSSIEEQKKFYKNVFRPSIVNERFFRKPFLFSLPHDNTPPITALQCPTLSNQKNHSQTVAPSEKRARVTIEEFSTTKPLSTNSNPSSLTKNSDSPKNVNSEIYYPENSERNPTPSLIDEKACQLTYSHLDTSPVYSLQPMENQTTYPINSSVDSMTSNLFPSLESINTTSSYWSHNPVSLAANSHKNRYQFLLQQALSSPPLPHSSLDVSADTTRKRDLVAMAKCLGQV
ncbi:hypothetical protein [Legionella fairfieldensis]|uniref:hypothetical protein n=1 Tax=Legionella fairfieldensis TaxID=45064 RepID=UPI00048D7B18|nr:hypothetical protein [Legionella fairfieldensis]